MIKWILQDVKRTIKSRKTYLLIAVIVISIASFLFVNMNKQPEYITMTTSSNGTTNQITVHESFVDIYNMSHAFDFKCLTNEDQENCEDFKTYEKYVNMLNASTDEVEQYELTLFLLDIATDDFLNYYDSQNDAFKTSINQKAIDIELIRATKEDIKTNISSKYDTFELSLSSPTIANFNNQAITLYETYVNYQSAYPQHIKYEMTSSFFIANYLNEFFLLIILITALVVFDSFYRDYKSGVIKTILSTPTRRFRYVVMKTISSVMSIMVVVFTPIIVTAAALYFINGYDSLNYPIYISRNAMSSFDPVLTYSRIINDEKPALYFSTYQNICSIAPVSQYPVDMPKAVFGAVIDCRDLFPAANISIITLSKYIPIIILYLILVIIFIASLNTLFSLLFNNQILNLIVLCATIGLSVIISKVFIGNVLLKFIPFTFISPTALMMGTIPYTFLNGVVTVTVWTLILTAINYIVIKRKDFSH